MANDERKFGEDAVLISVLALGLLGPVAIYLFKVAVPQIVVAVLLGCAVAALVYRWLGGISADTSFAIGALKLGGSMAALLGCAWFFNSQLVAQTSIDMDKLFKPHHKDWFAFDRESAAPVAVEVGELGEIEEPSADFLADMRLDISQTGDSYRVVSEKGGFSLGVLGQGDLEALGLGGADLPDGLSPFVVTRRLSADKSAPLDPIPFTLRTGPYGNEHSSFRLLSSDGTDVIQGSIYQKGARVFETDAGTWVVAVVEVDHGAGPPYAKFAVGKL